MNLLALAILLLTSLKFVNCQNKDCDFAPGLTFANEADKLKCCNSSEKAFHKKWPLGGIYLTTFLLKMKTWNCSQFERECENPTFDFTPFSQHVYKYFCKRQSFENQCIPELNSLVTNNGAEQSNITWVQTITNLNSSDLSLEQLTKPCVQVAMFDQELNRTDQVFGGYHEEITYFLPFCELVWCGADNESFHRGAISAWNCMSTRCRVTVIILAVTFALLAVAITTANILVISVFRRRKRLRNSQATYKISLALADLVVGLILTPTFISTLYFNIKPSVTSQTLQNVSGMLMDSNNASVNVSVGVLSPTGVSFYPPWYLGFVGFSTVTTFAVSIYTLMFASIDRFSAVFRPLWYTSIDAQRIAIRVTSTTWIACIIFASLPLFVPTLQFQPISSVLVASRGAGAVILYSFCFLLPLLVVWSVTTATYVAARKHAQVRRGLSNNLRARKSHLERRLARTLVIMVGCFSICLLPAVLMLLMSFFFTNITFTRPHHLHLPTALTYSSCEFLSVIFLASNSLFNVFIYSLRNKDFRRELSSVGRSMGFSRILGSISTSLRSSAQKTRRRLGSWVGDVTLTSASSQATNQMHLSKLGTQEGGVVGESVATPTVEGVSPPQPEPDVEDGS